MREICNIEMYDKIDDFSRAVYQVSDEVSEISHGTYVLEWTRTFAITDFQAAVATGPSQQLVYLDSVNFNTID